MYVLQKCSTVVEVYPLPRYGSLYGSGGLGVAAGRKSEEDASFHSEQDILDFAGGYILADLTGLVLWDSLKKRFYR